MRRIQTVPKTLERISDTLKTGRTLKELT